MKPASDGQTAIEALRVSMDTRFDRMEAAMQESMSLIKHLIEERDDRAKDRGQQ